MRHFLHVLPLCAVAFAWSCSSSSPAPTASGDADAGGDDGGASDSGPPCSDPSAQPSNTSCGTLKWAAAPVHSRKRNHHGTFLVTSAAGPALYVVAGVDANLTLPNVDRATINADGSLGAFTAEPPVPVPLGGIVGGVIGKVIVFAGGTDAAIKVTDQAYSSVVGDDGHLAPWKSAGSVLQPRMHGAAFVDQDTLYVMGGFRDPDVWDDVVKATVSQDGTVSPFTPAGKLPGKRSHMSVTFVDGYVYMTGGLESSAFRNPPVLTEVQRGHLVNGTIGEWTQMPDLPVELCTHGSFFYGGYVYVAGGIDDINQEAGVWRAPVNPDHSLGAWAKAAPLPIARGHVHHLPVLGTHVYSVAGAIDFNLNSTDQVDIGSFL